MPPDMTSWGAPYVGMRRNSLEHIVKESNGSTRHEAKFLLEGIVMNLVAALVRESGLTTKSRAMPTVFVVGEDASISQSLDFMICDEGWELSEFSSAQEFLSSPRVYAPSCLVLDMALPDINGLDLQQHIAAPRRDMPIIFVSGSGSIPMAVQAMKAGALEFFTKPFEGKDLLDAIRSAIEISRDTLSREAQLSALRERYETLSPREREVMALVVSGRMNKQVGGDLGISEITVKAHRGRAMQKMEAASLAHLVTIAAKLGVARAQSGRWAAE
jgi:FixJ family two-component response regulator